MLFHSFCRPLQPFPAQAPPWSKAPEGDRNENSCDRGVRCFQARRSEFIGSWTLSFVGPFLRLRLSLPSEHGFFRGCKSRLQEKNSSQLPHSENHPTGPPLPARRLQLRGHFEPQPSAEDQRSPCGDQEKHRETTTLLESKLPVVLEQKGSFGLVCSGFYGSSQFHSGS